MKRGVDHTGVAVVYFCHDGAGKVLMNKRNNNARDEHGRWDIGGGGIEFGKTAEETLRQEIAEEYATDVLEYEFLGYRDVLRQDGDSPTHWVALDFKVKVDAAKARNGEPHKFDDVRWFPFGELPEPVHSQFPIFLEKYKDRLSA